MIELRDRSKKPHERLSKSVCYGKAEVVVQDAVSYQKLLDMMEYLKAIAGIKEGLADVNAGRTLSLADFQQAMQEKHGISN